MAARRSLRLAGVLVTALTLAGCGLMKGLPEARSNAERLAALPTRDLPIERPVTIRWNEHAVPWIEAETDRDLAFALGLVHAHLRLGQMEILRRVSQGRISEMASFATLDIDHSLRALDLGRAAPEIVRAMPEETRIWADAYVAGINHYAATMRERPHEFTVLGLDVEPWTVEDVITFGRLASVDINWLRWFFLLPLQDRADWPEIWASVLEAGATSLPSFDPDAPEGLRRLSDLLAGVSRSGSNAVAVAGSRTASGGAMIASDPHLGLYAPGLWLIAGMRSPSVHAVGLMVPGLPFVALGRNPWIGWGGTNMQAGSSDLVDVSDLPDDQVTVRRERIGVRWWQGREVEIGETPYGPILSDAPLFPGSTNGPVALRWIGHRPTDELTAMLRLNRARDWDGFRAALDGFAISSQNMVYADRDGRIGLASAAMLPWRPLDPPEAIVQAPDGPHDWDRIYTSRDLPAIVDPPSGVIASANNPPAPAEIRLGWFFSPNDRIGRLNELLSANGRWTMEGLAELQRDVYRHSAVSLRDALLDRTDGRLTGLGEPERRALERVRAWDGHYRADSAEALAAEVTLAAFLEAFASEERRRAWNAINHIYEMVEAEAERAPTEAILAALTPALRRAAEALDTYGTWGGMHRLRLAHPLANAPLIGRRYVFADRPAAGSTTTIMKTAHRASTERHAAFYGSNARHISDLADPDANWFVVPGGQDGWINAQSFMDQLPLWEAGEYIRVPLTSDAVAREFPHRTTLSP